jgi:DNA-binding transcriptional regulator YbjK
MSWSSSSCRSGCPACARMRKAAIEVVGRGGLEALDDSALCSAAGVGAGEHAAHYGHAQACLQAAYEELAAEILAGYRAAFATAVSWREGLRAATEQLLARLARDPGEARLLFVEVLRAPGLRRQRDLARKASVAVFAREHERRRGPEQLADVHFELLQGAMFQLIASEVLAGRAARLQELSDELLTLAAVFEPIAA